MKAPTSPQPATIETMPEPAPLIAPEDAARLRERLVAMGLDPDAPVELGPSHDETPEQARERVAAREQARSGRWRERLPKTYATAHLNDLGPHVYATATRWLDDPDALNLVLAGDVGVGKTHAAYAIANHAVEHRRLWAEAWHAHDLLEAMRPDGDRYAYDRASRVTLLVLDDMGAVRPTDWARETMLALVNARVANRRRTIFTTNVASEVLRESWDPRLVDRMLEDSHTIVMRGPSRRKAAW